MKKSFSVNTLKRFLEVTSELRHQLTLSKLSACKVPCLYSVVCIIAVFAAEGSFITDYDTLSLAACRSRQKLSGGVCVSMYLGVIVSKPLTALLLTEFCLFLSVASFLVDNFSVRVPFGPVSSLTNRT